jgi:membrane fusion protein, multidrug efflux system
VSKQDYDNAVAAQGQAAADVMTEKAAVAIAKINLDYTNVVSPITGRTGLSLVTQGAYVQASAATLMTTARQIDPISPQSKTRSSGRPTCSARTTSSGSGGGFSWG